ncbi:acidic leucine-rich nuclear phosphoprotein 32-related protein-like [Prosopis cineraria]|uniref:acidic leucine-rich nuclear phosphoprotein 32-related protein-like n=1 Tax=Prosopis cineraria TaxID=364024 RepID=UPI00241079C6|nr:acidic leucine-rich nuclear phosphoprotein 32-related protein-like [Prosopis cineraria]
MNVQAMNDDVSLMLNFDTRFSSDVNDGSSTINSFVGTNKEVYLELDVHNGFSDNNNDHDDTVNSVNKENHDDNVIDAVEHGDNEQYLHNCYAGIRNDNGKENKLVDEEEKGNDNSISYKSIEYANEVSEGESEYNSKDGSEGESEYSDYYDLVEEDKGVNDGDEDYEEEDEGSGP